MMIARIIFQAFVKTQIKLSTKESHREGVDFSDGAAVLTLIANTLENVVSIETIISKNLFIVAY